MVKNKINCLKNINNLTTQNFNFGCQTKNKIVTNNAIWSVSGLNTSVSIRILITNFIFIYKKVLNFNQFAEHCQNLILINIFFSRRTWQQEQRGGRGDGGQLSVRGGERAGHRRRPHDDPAATRRQPRARRPARRPPPHPWHGHVRAQAHEPDAPQVAATRHQIPLPQQQEAAVSAPLDSTASLSDKWIHPRRLFMCPWYSMTPCVVVYFDISNAAWSQMPLFLIIV